MCPRQMHVDEADIDEALVRRLLSAQFPDLAGLPLSRFASSGTDHAIFRLGPDMCVRLPRIRGAVEQLHKEHRWLPVLAPHLPLSVPEPIVMGTPAEGYPWHWSVYRWLDGVDATVQPPKDLQQTATTLGSFVGALQRVDPSDGPPPGEHNFGRGVPLAARDEPTVKALETLAPVLDIGAATAAWRSALRAPPWDGPPVWLHGDLSPLNLLVQRGEITGVIDFGGMAVGDPACDLLCAWAVLADEARAVLREVLEVDGATWERGRGWALSVGLILIPYYSDTNPTLADLGRKMVDEVLADHGEERPRRAWK